MNPWLSFGIGILVGIIIIIVFLRILERNFILISNPVKGYTVRVNKTETADEIIQGEKESKS